MTYQETGPINCGSKISENIHFFNDVRIGNGFVVVLKYINAKVDQSNSYKNAKIGLLHILLLISLKNMAGRLPPCQSCRVCWSC